MLCCVVWFFFLMFRFWFWLVVVVFIFIIFGGVRRRSVLSGFMVSVLLICFLILLVVFWFFVGIGWCGCFIIFLVIELWWRRCRVIWSGFLMRVFVRGCSSSWFRFKRFWRVWVFWRSDFGRVWCRGLRRRDLVFLWCCCYFFF